MNTETTQLWDTFSPSLRPDEVLALFSSWHWKRMTMAISHRTKKGQRERRHPSYRVRGISAAHEGLYEVLGLGEIALCGREINAYRFHSITSGDGANDLLALFWF